jgi:N-acetyl-gamma-glutamyl-phosphate reductase
VFFATPGGVAMNEAQKLVDAGVRVLDLSADFRLRDVAEWEHWYGMKHACPALIEQAAYGLPEMHRATIKTARLVAVPGCYPTAVQLGFLPLVEAQVVDTENLIADAKSGVSGAGRKTEVALLHGEVAENFKAYNVPGHRHLPEIRQGLAGVLGRSVGLTFVAHLLPIVRGIHATLYARLTRETDLQALYEERYRNEPFVDVLPPGTHPETRWVRASNMCRIALHKPQGRDTAVVLAVIDNLVKGAAGQAVQNLNLMFGFEETLGLTQIAVVP